MDINIEQIKAAAMKATRGEWHAKKHGVVSGGPVQHFTNGSSQQQIMLAVGCQWMEPGEQYANADYVAAAYPDVVLELIARLERAEAQPVRYFVYDHEGGYNEFKTDAERDKAHQEAIDGYLDDGWSEEVTGVVSGIVTHKTVKTNEERRPSPCAQHPEHDNDDCEACDTWNEYPNHDFETCCQYEPEPIAAPASPAGDQEKNNGH